MAMKLNWGDFGGHLHFDFGPASSEGVSADSSWVPGAPGEKILTPGPTSAKPTF